MLELILKRLLASLPEANQHTQIWRDGVAHAVGFVAQALNNAPWYLRVVERVARPFLTLWLLLGLPVRWLERLGGSVASVLRVYRSLGLLGYMEAEVILHHRGRITVPMRQQEYRAQRRSRVAP